MAAAGATTLGKIRLVGIPWFNERDYLACRALMADSELLPLRYSDWLKVVQCELEEVLSQGHTPLKVHIELAKFPAWCRERMLVRDRVARRRYASLIAFQKMDI